MSDHISKAHILFGTEKYELAIQELQKELVKDPESAEAKMLFSLCLVRLKKYEEALEEALGAVSLQPNNSSCYYYLAVALRASKKSKDAEKSIREAISLSPHNALYFAFLGRIFEERGSWKKALKSASDGLEINPEHADCLNIKITSLTRLGNEHDALNILKIALANYPENAEVHANAGWLSIEYGDRIDALASFSEALRLEPKYDWAREGMVQAMKARNIFYYVFLKYFYIAGAWGGGMLFHGLGLLLSIMTTVAIWIFMSYVDSELFLYVLVIPVLYMSFMLFTWIAEPLFNCILSFDSVGRHALSRVDFMSSRMTMVVLIGIPLLIGISYYFEVLSLACVLIALMAVPTYGIIAPESDQVRLYQKIYYWFLWIMGGIFLSASLLQSLLMIMEEVVTLFFIAFFITYIISFLVMPKQPK